MEDEKTPEQLERAECDRIVLRARGGRYGTSWVVDVVVQAREAVRREMWASNAALQAERDTAREQRDTYYEGMKEAKAQLSTLRTAAERAANMLEQYDDDMNGPGPGTHAYRWLRAALDSTKPTSEP